MHRIKGRHRGWADGVGGKKEELKRQQPRACRRRPSSMSGRAMSLSLEAAIKRAQSAVSRVQASAKLPSPRRPCSLSASPRSASPCSSSSLTAPSSSLHTSPSTTRSVSCSPPELATDQSAKGPLSASSAVAHRDPALCLHQLVRALCLRASDVQHLAPRRAVPWVAQVRRLSRLSLFPSRAAGSWLIRWRH